MPVIYFDNFRGFNKTFLPLKKVNFFVGENSSGKTSVLKLIKILSDHKFWFTQEFNSDEAELGYYSEIASYANKNKKYFEIGILGDYRDKDDGISAIKLKFTNNEGIPSVKEISLIRDDVNIQAIVESDYIKYRYSPVNLSNITEVNKLKYFKKWIAKNDLVNKPFVKDENSSPFLTSAILFHVQTIIAQIKSPKKKINEKRHSFYMPNFLQDVAWLAPIRTDPKRTYDSYKIAFNPDGTHAPYLLKRLLGKETTQRAREKAQEILRKFGKDSGLFDSIKINPLGRGDNSPFELQVLLNNFPLKITNVGYGVSQILPLIIEVIARQNETWFAIQQPEIHLHPRGQAAFGDFIYKSVINDNKNFIIETHSDYTIDRYRLRLYKGDEDDKAANNKINSQIVFFKRSNGINELTCIPIMNNGSLPDTQPSEFRDFFIKEQLELLQI
ncbi:MAG TPA: AAA family ATPase [Bacteroidia bacterium]|nr:AAA family ATPase [Bacteroidia bacterium]